jgi:multiple sugar transport system substrate-binding protein
MKKKVLIVLLCLFAGTMIFANGQKDISEDTVTIEFMQWWAPEMGEEKFQVLIDGFEKENPGIKVKLISLPFSEVLNQVQIGTATGTIADVIGISSTWIHTLATQDVLIPLDTYIENESLGSVLVDVPKVNGKQFNIQLATFIFPFFYNKDMLKEAGFERPPTTWSEFEAYAEKLTIPAKNQYALAMPLSLAAPAGVQNDFFPWIWSTGENALKDGKANFQTPAVIGTLEYFKGLYDKGYLSPGTLAKKEQEKVEEFVSGRVAFINTSLAQVNLMKERSPDLNFGLTTIPVPDGYNGKPAICFNGWNVGITKSSKHADAAWKLVSYLLKVENNAYLSSNANAFPGNKEVEMEIDPSNTNLLTAFKMYQNSRLINEFYGTPSTLELQRRFLVEMHKMFEGDQTATQAAVNAEKSWKEIYDQN